MKEGSKVDGGHQTHPDLRISFEAACKLQEFVSQYNPLVTLSGNVRQFLEVGSKTSFGQNSGFGNHPVDSKGLDMNEASGVPMSRSNWEKRFHLEERSQIAMKMRREGPTPGTYDLVVEMQLSLEAPQEVVLMKRFENGRTAQTARRDC